MFRPWKIIAIVLLVATVLGGAFLGYRSAGTSRTERDVSAALAVGSSNGAGSAVNKKNGKPGTLSSSLLQLSDAERNLIASADAAEKQSLADILRSGDKAALDRLLPQGIREIEGMGGKGLSRQVKSHGMWFPVFDLSQAKKTTTGGASSADSNADDTEDVDPESVKLAKIPLSIVAPPPSAGLVGQIISMVFHAVGGAPPYQWTLQTLGEATGFAIDPLTGVVSGSTSEPTQATFVITVHDTAQEQSSITAALTVTPSKPLTITTDSLPDAIVGKAYAATLTASGGVPPLTWSIANAPPDWQCDPSGALSAMPAQATDFELAVTVMDSQGTMAQQTLHARATEGLQILTESPLMPAAPGETYTVRLEADGGTAPYRWSLASGALPPGWNLSDDGLLSGMAGTQEQVFHLVLEVRDNGNLSQRKDFELAMRRLLIAIASKDKAGLAWQPSEVARVARVPLLGVTVQRDGQEIYRGMGNNIVDYGLTTGGTYRYTLYAHTQDGRAVPVSSSMLRVLPITKQRAIAGVLGDPYADRVRSFQPLTPGGYGSAYLPNNVTGPPDGRSTFAPAWQETEVVSLHANKQGGGNIVLEFTDNIICNESGADFTVFENVPFVNRDPSNRYMEPAIVEVALFEGQWFRFPTRVSPPASGSINFRQPTYYAVGFTGVNATTGDDPTDPTRSGGDSFDLDSLGMPDLHWIRFIRIRATGDGVMADSQGSPIRHTTENNALSGKETSGFDLDAVSAAHY